MIYITYNPTLNRWTYVWIREVGVDGPYVTYEFPDGSVVSLSRNDPALYATEAYAQAICARRNGEQPKFPY